MISQIESFTSAAGIPRLLLPVELLLVAAPSVVESAMGLDGRASCELSGCDVLGCDKGWAIGGGDGCALRRGAELREPDWA